MLPERQRPRRLQLRVDLWSQSQTGYPWGVSSQERFLVDLRKAGGSIRSWRPNQIWHLKETRLPQEGGTVTRPDIQSASLRFGPKYIGQSILCQQEVELSGGSGRKSNYDASDLFLARDMIESAVQCSIARVDQSELQHCEVLPPCSVPSNVAGSSAGVLHLNRNNASQRIKTPTTKKANTVTNPPGGSVTIISTLWIVCFLTSVSPFSKLAETRRGNSLAESGSAGVKTGSRTCFTFILL